MNLPEDRWYTAVEIKPSARAYVHHIIAYTEPHSDQPARRGRTFGPTNITGVSPNKPGLVLEPGVAKLLRAGHDIILEVHYTTNGAEATDRTQGTNSKRHRDQVAATYCVAARAMPNA